MSRTKRKRGPWMWAYTDWPRDSYLWHRDYCCQSICCSQKARRKFDKHGGKWMTWGERKRMQRGAGDE